MERENPQKKSLRKQLIALALLLESHQLSGLRDNLCVQYAVPCAFDRPSQVRLNKGQAFQICLRWQRMAAPLPVLCL